MRKSGLSIATRDGEGDGLGHAKLPRRRSNDELISSSTKEASLTHHPYHNQSQPIIRLHNTTTTNSRHFNHDESKTGDNNSNNNTNNPNNSLARQKWINQMKSRREEFIAVNTERNMVKKALYENPEIFNKNANLKFQTDWINMMPPDIVNPCMVNVGGVSEVDSATGHGTANHASIVLSPSRGAMRGRLSLPGSLSPTEHSRTRAHTHTIAHGTSHAPDASKSTHSSASAISKDSTMKSNPTGVGAGAGAGAGVSILDSDMDDDDEFPPLPTAARRLSVGGIAGAETPTPITHNFLQHTVGIEELRNHMSGQHVLLSPTSSPRGDGEGNSFHYASELLSKYTRPRNGKQKKTNDHNGKKLLSHSKSSGEIVYNKNEQTSGSGESDHVEEKIEDEDEEEEVDRCTLIDSLFLVGPKDDEIEQFVDSVLDEVLEPINSTLPTDDSAGEIKDTARDSWGKSTRSLSVDSAPPSVYKRTHYSVTPDMMFISSEDPLVETEVLPAFCFPRGIETTVAVLPTKVSIMSPSRRKPSPRYASKQKLLFQTKTSSGGTSCNRFIFLLSNHTSNQFGICMTVPRIVSFEKRNKSIKVKTSYCLTILSEFPFFSFFFQLLTEYVNMKGFCVDATTFVTKQSAGDLLQYELRHLESFAMRLIRHTIPHVGQSLVFSFTMNMIRKEITIKRLLITNRVEENCVGTLLWALPILLKNFELDLILEVIGCLLTEMKVVIRCKNLEILSACILSFVYLLRPLKWVCPTIVILPASMIDFLESPVPVILGVESTPSSFVMTNGLVVVDPEQRVIHWHPSDLVTKKALTLPKVVKLQQQLKPLMVNILKLTKKLKKARMRTLALSNNDFNLSAKSCTNGILASTSSDSDDMNNQDVNTSNSISTGLNEDEDIPTRPVSLNIPSIRSSLSDNTISDDDYVQSPLLASAIATFSATVSQHLLKVVMTAIHMKWKLYQLKLQQKNDLANVPREPQSVSSKQNASDESIGSESSTIFSNDNSQSNNTNYNNGNHAPPPPPGAVWFSQQDLGSGGFTFMQSFIHSQMFCNYVQQQDEDEAKARQERQRERETFMAKQDSNDDVSVIDGDESIGSNDEDSDTNSVDVKIERVEKKANPNMGSLSRLSSGGRHTPRLDDHMLPVMKDDTHAYSRMMSLPDASPRKDPLISLFAILLTGSYPLSQGKVDDLFAKCNTLYSNDIDDDDPFASDELEFHMSAPDNETHKKYPIYIEDTTTIEAGLLCNGRCLGLANTPSCTNICLELWEEKAQHLRRQASVVDIIRRRGASMTPGVIKTSSPHKKKAKMPSGSLTNLDLYRSILPKRHKRETIGQYLHRTSLITGRSESDILEEINITRESDQSRELANQRSNGMQQSLHNQNMQPAMREELLPPASSMYVQGGVKSAHSHMLPRNMLIHETGFGIAACAPSNTITSKVSPAVRAIAQNRTRKSYLKRQQMHREFIERAATLIQKEFRGYIVRCNIVFIISSLLQRKKRSTSNVSEFEHRYRTISSSGDTDSTGGVLTTYDDNDDDTGCDIVNRVSDETDSILHQSDHQFFAEDLVDNVDSVDDSSQLRLSSDRKSSYCRSSTYSERSPTSRLVESSTNPRHYQSSGYLLAGLLPAGRNKEKTSLSLSPSSVFTRGRAQGRLNDKDKGSNLHSPSSDVIRRSLSDSLYSSKDLASASDCDRAPLTAEQRKHSFSRILMQLSTDSNDKGGSDYDIIEEGDEVLESNDSFYDSMSPRLKSPFRTTKSIDDGDTCSDNLVVFDESLLNEDGVPLPVHSLGLRAGDILSQPEQLCVVTLWQLLRPGILVLKHGRSGKPKNRTLFCDDNLQVLFWRDADGTAGAAAAEYQQQHQHQLDIDRNKATRRSSFNVFSKQDSSREVVLRDVLEVRSDLTTDVMRRSVSKKYVFEGQHSLVISLILKDRTLDFQIDEKQWEPVYRALQIIVDFYQKQVQLLDKY